jgi:thiol:disulfide interchange protein
VLVFAALGLGLAIPFLLIAFVPALRNRLPKPGPWMRTLQRFLAIPMGLSALAALWLLWRQGGELALLFGLFAGAALALCLYFVGRMQARGRPQVRFAIILGLVVVIAAVARVPASSSARIASVAGAEPWSEARVASYVAQGKPVFVYFTADWCLTCKVNEATAIDNAEVRAAFDKARVKVLAGDWTNGDPAITRFLEAHGRAGVPYYLWIDPTSGEGGSELPQILTPGLLVTLAKSAGGGPWVTCDSELETVAAQPAPKPAKKEKPVC